MAVTANSTGLDVLSTGTRPDTVSHRLGDWLASGRITTLPIDIGLFAALTTALITHEVVMWFHMIFVLLVLAALVLPFRQFVTRLVVWMSITVALVTWAVISLDVPSDELSELPLLTLVLVLVYLVAQSRSRALHAIERARADLEDRTVIEHEVLQHQLEDAQRRELIGRASAGLAHDLRNVFVAIRGCCDELRLQPSLLAGDTTGNQVVDVRSVDVGCVDDLTGATERGLAIIDDLLWLGRRHEYESRSVDLSLALRQVEPLLRRMIRPGIVLRVDAPAADSIVRIDHVGLSQVLMNLVSNAADAIDGEGHITVSARRSVSGTNNRDEVTTVTVTDDGAGFDPDTLTRAFEPDFTTKDGTHAGFGLATVWRIVDRCGGTIQIDSSQGQGTTVSVRLTRVSAQAGLEVTSPEVPLAEAFAANVLSDLDL